MSLDEYGSLIIKRENLKIISPVNQERLKIRPRTTWQIVGPYKKPDELLIVLCVWSLRDLLRDRSWISQRSNSSVLVLPRNTTNRPSATEYIQFKLQCSYLELSTPLDQLYNIIFSVTITNLVPTLSATVQRLLRGIGGVPHSFNFVSVRGLYVPRVRNDNGQ